MLSGVLEPVYPAEKKKTPHPTPSVPPPPASPPYTNGCVPQLDLTEAERQVNCEIPTPCSSLIFADGEGLGFRAG